MEIKLGAKIISFEPQLWPIETSDWSSRMAKHFGSWFGYEHFAVHVHAFLGAKTHLAEPISTAQQTTVM
jgi:hypothetical protein